MASLQRPLVLGRINGLFGVKGWVKVYSYTRPPENILDYAEWCVGAAGYRRVFRVIDTRIQGKSLLVHLADYSGTPLADRDTAIELLDTEIAVDRSQLPDLAEGEFYWCDLIGLEVVDRDGVAFGPVVALMETGANDVLVVGNKPERLIPFVMHEVVERVDLAVGRIVVNWDLDF